MKKSLLLFFLFISLCFSKYVELGDVTITYDIGTNGYVHVSEEVTYLLEDCKYDTFNEIYSEKPRGLDIKNPSGFCSNARCNFRYDDFRISKSGSNELVLELVNKKCGEINTNYEYDVTPLVKTRDTTQFYYKVWGELSPDAEIIIKIILPYEIDKTTIEYEKKEVEIIDEETGEIYNITVDELTKNETSREIVYFIHKDNENYEIIESNNVIEIKSVQNEGEFLEINLLMPNEWFKDNDDFIYRRDISKSQIIEEEKKDELLRKYKKIIDIILTLMFIVYLLIPFIILAIIYFIYGKEYTPNELNYENIYEREIPSNHNPAEVMFFIKGDENYSKEEEINAIIATIMSLVNKGIGTIEEKNKEVYFTFDYKKYDKNKFKKYECLVIEYVQKTFGTQRWTLKEFERKCSKEVEYYQMIEKFFIHIRKINRKKIYVETKGNKIGNISLIIYFFLTIFVSMIQPLAFIGYIFALVAMFIIRYKKIMLAKWTEEGRILNLKWENFRKYITDYSLMKEHPPESIKIWDEYLTYAIALGVAKETIQIMKKIAPKEIGRNKKSLSYIYINSPSLLRMNRTFTPRYASKKMGGSSGGGYSGRIGGSGGGMGGGGFGAR